MHNADMRVVADFGQEWQSFNQQAWKASDLQRAFMEYFHIFPLDQLNHESVGFDMGCGSGRWATLIAPRVGTLHCIDASSLALDQARHNLAGFDNCHFECASVNDCSLKENSQDFGYCLGVLHHIPDSLSGLKACVQKLKPGAPFLLYLYYRFDNKPTWFKAIWRVSDYLRRLISPLPHPLKLAISQVIALSIYWPLSRLAGLLERLGCKVDHLPLSAYRNKPLYCLRTDALDRFGTRLEQRFTQAEIKDMMLQAGLSQISFSQQAPFWVAVGIKRPHDAKQR